MGLLDKVKALAGNKKSQADLKAKAQSVAQKVDDKAADLAKKDGKVGDIAAKAHDALDKVDGD